MSQMLNACVTSFFFFNLTSYLQDLLLQLGVIYTRLVLNKYAWRAKVCKYYIVVDLFFCGNHYFFFIIFLHYAELTLMRPDDLC